MNQRNENVLDLGLYLADGDYDFSDRTRGIAVRTKSNIDQLIDVSDMLTIVIPEEVYTMSKAFWKELLSNAILDLGKEQFYQKVNFNSKGRYQPERDICEIVNEISQYVP